MSKIQLMNLSVSLAEVQVQEQEATKGGNILPTWPPYPSPFPGPTSPFPLPSPFPGPTFPIPPIPTWP